jgi:hypothetical protein
MVPACSAVVWLILLFSSSAAIAQVTATADSLFVENTAGAVRILQDDEWQPPHTGMSIALPAVVSTGSDGSIRLRQSETVIAVAADTAIELYRGSAGQTLQRVVQKRGSAFYDIAPRGESRLRVETPYLVAVIKGTEFNVTVTPESSTVALFEGRLQVEAPDIGDVRDLFEGQIARRHRGDSRITVISMEDGEPVARQVSPGHSTGSPGDDSDADIVGDGPGNVGPGNVRIDTGADLGGSDADVSIDRPAVDDSGLQADLVGDLGLDEAGAGATIGATAGPDFARIDAGLDADTDFGSGNVDVTADVGVDLGGVGVDAALDVGLDIGSGELDLNADVGADLGDVSVDAGLDAAVDLGGGELDLGADVGADLGDVSVDAGLDAAVDLGGGELDVGADIGTDLGDAGLDVGLDAGADLSGGELAADLDSAVDLGGDTIDLDAGAAADLGDGHVEVDAGIGGVDLGLDLDLGGGLDDLLDVDLGVDDSMDDDESEDDEPDDGLLPDLLDLLGL